MRGLLILFVVISTPASADPTDQRDLAEYTRIASAAASQGDCPTALDLGARVQALDPAYYVEDFATHPAIATCLSMSSGARDDREPPLTPAGLIGQLVVGGLGSIAGGFGGLVVADKFCDGGGNPDACFGSALLGVFIGGSLGFAAGVYFGGSLGDQTGSFAATMLGATLGGSLAILGVASSDETAGILVLLVAAPVGALVGFNATRRWKPGKGLTVGSLLRTDRGQVSFGVPLVTHGDHRGVTTTTIPVFSGSF